MTGLSRWFSVGCYSPVVRLLFDLDGTLTDPFLGITRCIQHALKTLDHPVPPADDLRWCIGPPLHDSFLTLLNTADDRLAAKAVEIYRERFGTVGLFENEIYPGTIECLETLSDQGHTLSVATSKPTVFARRIIDHFNLANYFTAVDGSELDGTRGDKTSLIAHILKRDKVTPDDVLMIGDRKHDMIGAAENGVRGIGVLWGYGSTEELQSAGACTIVNAPADLEAEVAKICRVKN